MSPFLIKKGIQGIVGTPKSVKKTRDHVLFLLKSQKQHSTSLLDFKSL